MKKNITTTIYFKKNSLEISCFEKVSSNLVEIFFEKKRNFSNHLEKIIFIDESIKKINELINAKVSMVAIVIEEDKKINFQTKIITKKIDVVKGNISELDIKNCLELISQNEKMNLIDNEIINIEPLGYEVVYKNKVKKYSKAPVNKDADTLQIKTLISTINKKACEYVGKIIEKSNLKYSQILTANQSLVHQKLSDIAIQEGAIVINLSNK
jgi:cell division ATPase FtsA